MENIQRDMIKLLRSAVEQRAFSLSEGFRMEEAYPYIRRHHIATLAYEGAVLCGVDRSGETMKQLFPAYCRALVISEGQMAAAERLFAAFEEQGIEYMPLKGCKMKALYPKHELRTMGDVDVLIRLEQYDRIAVIMKQLGYEMQAESDHELVWKSPKLLVELHKRLIPSYNKDFYAYFGDGWQLAGKKTGTRWEMEPEDEFVYLFTHFAKHFRDGGIGCRHVLDLWVWLRHHPGLDLGRVEAELETLRLRDFYRNIDELMEAWFADGPENDRTRVITDYIFASGSWGDLQTKRLSIGVRDAQHTGSAAEGKLRYVWRLLFPNRTTMGILYPAVKKAPWLMPFAWLWRLVGKLFVRTSPLSHHGREMALLTQDNLDQRRQLLDYMGIGYHF